MASAGDGNETAEPDSYCPSCGSGVAASDRYCGACGHDLSESASEQSPEEELRLFRARVSDHVANGWDIQYDAGDEVALVNRGYGSIVVHILLFPFTSGIGNLLYGWYHYEHTAERKVIRAHGPDSSPTKQPTQAVSEPAPVDKSEDGDQSLSGYVWGLLLLVLGVATLTSVGLSAVGITMALAFFVLATLLLPPTRRRIENRHPPTTFGPTTSVDERFVANTDKPCSVCFDRVHQGVRRAYDQSYVFAGLPLYTIERGENWYCESCRDQTTDADEVRADSLDAELEAIKKERTQPESDIDAATAGCSRRSAHGTNNASAPDSLETAEEREDDT